VATEARVIQCCDAAAARLAARLPDAEVTVGFVPRYDRRTLTGEKVWVFPVSDKEAGKLTRASDQMGPRIAVVYAAKCPDSPDTDSAEPVPVAWVRERILRVETDVYDFLRQERVDEVDPVIEGVWPEMAEWVSVFDSELLSADKVFWSEIEVEFGFPT
jgi:hypothetical protein